MNKKNKNIFQKDIVVPEIVQLKAEEAFLQIKEKGTNNMKENNIINFETKSGRYRKLIKPVIAACTCAALIIAVGRFNNFNVANETNKEETYVKTAELKDLTQSLSNMFTLKVYAANSPEAAENGYVTLETGKSILLNDSGLGSVLNGTKDGFISYCVGTQFLCEGENIDSITYSITNAAFQIVERPDSSIIIEGEEYAGGMNAGVVGGEDTEDLEQFLSVIKYYKSYTVSYDNQSNDHTWFNICDETDTKWDDVFGKDKDLEDRVNGIDNMTKDIVITCTVHYTDGTSSSANITIGGGVITPNVTGIPEKDKPYAGFEFRLE